MERQSELHTAAGRGVPQRDIVKEAQRDVVLLIDPLVIGEHGGVPDSDAFAVIGIHQVRRLPGELRVLRVMIVLQVSAEKETVVPVLREPKIQLHMPNGRCRLHGGLSTGPKTTEGIEHIRRAVTKHGRYSHAVKTERHYGRILLRECRELLKRIG